jgi:hypothetical protein
MDLKKKYSQIKTKIKRHPECIAAIGSMLVTGAVLGYCTGKELSKYKKRAHILAHILDDVADGEKHAVWLEDGKFYVETRPLSEEDLK